MVLNPQMEHQSSAMTLCVQTTYHHHQFLGAPPMVASGKRSMVYRCEARYIIGTPGICNSMHYLDERLYDWHEQHNNVDDCLCATRFTPL